MRLNALNVKMSIVLIGTVLLAVLLVVHAPFMNGPYYWKWPWRRIGGWRYFPGMLAAAVPLVGAIFVFDAGKARTVLAIVLVMLSMFAMEIVEIGMTVQPFSLTKITYFVESPMSMSYYADAYRSIDASVAELLQRYPAYMPEFYIHSQEKPPGPILFFRAIIQACGVSDGTATLAGLIIGALATLAIPATYLLIRTLTGDGKAAFLGCAMLSLSPGMVLMFPVMDQLYPIVTCLLLITWVMALRTGKMIWAVAFGLFLAAGCFVVYHFLVLGVFLSVATIAHVVVVSRQKLKAVFWMMGVGGLTVVLIYLILFGYVGFNVIRVFETALVEQQKHLASLVRPYPRTVVFDLTDFAMGAGWIPVILGIMAMINPKLNRSWRGWGMLCWLQIVVLALSGLMQGETARIWLFLQPLAMTPAAMELSAWPRKSQLVVFVAMWVLLCLVGQNLTFMY
jgi:hypothetical protein